MPQAVDNMIVLQSFGDRKVTVYTGTRKHEATEVALCRQLDYYYPDAVQCMFKPKRARRNRRFVDNHNNMTVVLDGWAHPEFDWLLRALEETPSVETRPGVTVQTVSYTVQRGGTSQKDKYELEFEQYLRDIDPAKILFNNREKPATT
jgi:hypothetical protein